jgi:hypothetical protein
VLCTTKYTLIVAYRRHRPSSEKLKALSLWANIDKGRLVWLPRESADEDSILLVQLGVLATAILALEYELTSIHPILERHNLVVVDALWSLALAKLELVVLCRRKLLIALIVEVTVTAVDSYRLQIQ